MTTTKTSTKEFHLPAFPGLVFRIAEDHNGNAVKVNDTYQIQVRRLGNWTDFCRATMAELPPAAIASMTYVVDRSTDPALLTEVERAGGDIVLATEASDIGLPPGTWPGVLWLVPKTGNGLIFAAHFVKRNAHGEIQWIDYRQHNGCMRVRVFND